MARSIIRDNHTLNPTPVWVAYSWLRPIRNAFGGGNKANEEPLLGEGESENQLNKKKKKAKVDEEQLH